MNNKKDKILRVSVPAKFELKTEKKDGKDYRLIKAYVSMFNNVDLVGDIIVQGAFAESIKKKLPKGVWSHNWDEPIAKTIHASEDEKGLYIEAEFVEGVQKSDEAYKLIKAGVIDEFSIGFRILDDEWRDDGVRIIKKAKLYEWSPVLAGANPDTELVSIKTDDDGNHEKDCSCDSCVKSEEEVIDEAIDEVQDEEKEEKGIIEDEMQFDEAEQNKKWKMIYKMDDIFYKFVNIYLRATIKSTQYGELAKEFTDLIMKLESQFEEITKGEFKGDSKKIGMINAIEKIMAEKSQAKNSTKVEKDTEGDEKPAIKVLRVLAKKQIKEGHKLLRLVK